MFIGDFVGHIPFAHLNANRSTAWHIYMYLLKTVKLRIS